MNTTTCPDCKEQKRISKIKNPLDDTTECVCLNCCAEWIVSPPKRVRKKKVSA
jgi:hypothetical protein